MWRRLDSVAGESEELAVPRSAFAEMERTLLDELGLGAFLYAIEAVHRQPFHSLHRAARPADLDGDDSARVAEAELTAER